MTDVKCVLGATCNVVRLISYILAQKTSLVARGAFHTSGASIIRFVAQGLEVGVWKRRADTSGVCGTIDACQ